MSLQPGLGTIVFTDGTSQTRAVTYRSAHIGSSLIADAIADASTCGAVSLYGTQLITVHPGQRTYSTPVLSVARLTFKTDNGNKATIHVPGADPAMFLGDNETVDPSAPLTAAVIAAVLAQGITEAGEQLTVYISGKRERLPATPVGLK